jgi:two-component system, NtrC family, nitrogen regulation response regulator NtrX
LQQRLEQASRLKTPVLMTGEPGCGFDLCARQLHQRNTPWQAPADLTWLTTNPFEPLNEVKDGVLYLSEIHTLQRPEQKGLLQLTAKLEKFNVRLVCSASQPLVPLVEQDRFDAQLFSQISALTLRVPSLKEHAEDIPDIASTLLSQMVDAGEVPPRNLSVAALNVLRNLSWPGNLPVLRNVIKTLALTVGQTDISAEDVHRVVHDFGLDAQEAAPAFAGVPLDMPLREARERFEYQYFLHHIRREDSNMSRVADRVGLERTHLYRKLKQLGIKPSGKTEEPAN